MSLRSWTTIVGLVALTGLLGLALGMELTLAADLPVIPQHRHPGIGVSRPDTGTRLEEFAQGPNANCTAWTDGCRACGKGPAGVVCSNVGIACLPSPPRCVRP